MFINCSSRFFAPIFQKKKFIYFYLYVQTPANIRWRGSAMLRAPMEAQLAPDRRWLRTLRAEEKVAQRIKDTKMPSEKLTVSQRAFSCLSL